MAEPRRRGPRSVRWRVTLLAAVAVAVVLVAAGAVLVGVQRRVLLDQLDETLVADAGRIVVSMEGGREPDLRVSADDDAVAEVLPAEVPGATATVVRTISGRRVVSRPFELDGRRLVVRVAAPLDDVDESVRALLLTLAVLVPTATAVLAALVWLLVGRTLRPVEQIRAEVAGIGLDELGRRVPVPPGQDEIARLAGTMNEMLARLDASNRRQQRFVADASHELRTPLARMRTEIEVAQRANGGGPEVLGSVLEEVGGLQRLTEDLLVLARSDAGASPGERRPVDLEDVVLEQARVVDTRGRTVDTRQVSAAQVVGERDQLGRVIANLLDNAVVHAATTVTLSLAESDESVVLAVADDGPGIPVDRRDEVFERFGRLDEARSAGRGGTGLGLAITRDVVERHGGTITLDPDYRAGARFVVTLPSSAPAEGRTGSTRSGRVVGVDPGVAQRKS
jgi:signal transduction histidine kinase